MFEVGVGRGEVGEGVVALADGLPILGVCRGSQVLAVAGGGSLIFAKDPQVAEQQMAAIIVYLTTFGYIDGDFDAKEKEFVRKYIGDLVSALTAGRGRRAIA